MFLSSAHNKRLTLRFCQKIRSFSGIFHGILQIIKPSRVIIYAEFIGENVLKLYLQQAIAISPKNDILVWDLLQTTSEY